MMVRFKKQFSGLDTEQRIAYETVSDEPDWDYDEDERQWILKYELKGFGFVPSDYLEEAEETDLPFTDVLIQLQKDK